MDETTKSALYLLQHFRVIAMAFVASRIYERGHAPYLSTRGSGLELAKRPFLQGRKAAQCPVVTGGREHPKSANALISS